MPNTRFPFDCWTGNVHRHSQPTIDERQTLHFITYTSIAEVKSKYVYTKHSRPCTWRALRRIRRREGRKNLENCHFSNWIIEHFHYCGLYSANRKIDSIWLWCVAGMHQVPSSIHYMRIRYQWWNACVCVLLPSTLWVWVWRVRVSEII